MRFDLVIKNGAILTMDDAFSRKRWVAVKDGKITAVGDRDDAPDAERVIDLGKNVLLPGFIDSHEHSTLTGIGLTGIELAGVNNKRDILEKIEAFCKKDSSGRLIMGSNLGLPEEMQDGKLPTRYELDEVSNGHPVMLVFWTAHGGVVNSKALEHAFLEDGMEYVKEAGYFNDDKTSFHVIANVMELLSYEEVVTNYRSVAKLAASKGVTTAHSLDGMFMKDDRDVDVLTKVKDDMPLDFVIYDQTFDLEKVKGYGLSRIGGCLSVDGSPPQYTAAYSVDYPSRPGTRGLLNYSDRELYEFVLAASKAGMQCAFHAIGDRAIDQIIYIYWQVHHEVGIKHLRHRIEHFSVPSEKHIQMALEMNVIGTAQPAIGARLDSPAGKMCGLFVPEEKVDIHENFSIPMKAGIIMPGGSDSPVTPIDPLLGIESAVNAYNPQRRISLDEALKMYTVYGAYAAHEEKEKGSIEIGKAADFVLLDQDPYEKEKELNTIKIVETIFRGKTTFKV